MSTQLQMIIYSVAIFATLHACQKVSPERAEVDAAKGVAVANQVSSEEHPAAKAFRRAIAALEKYYDLDRKFNADLRPIEDGWFIQFVFLPATPGDFLGVTVPNDENIAVKIGVGF